MKKFIFIFSLLSMFLLFSFSKKTYPPTNTITTAPSCASCGTATNLGAVKSGSYVTLSWYLDPTNVSNCSYGGYFNSTGGVVNFGSTTSTWPITIPCPSGAYSIHFAITANCSDGSHTYSYPYFGPL